MSIETDVYQLVRRRTKIVVTLGPASSSSKVIAGLIGAGVNVFRLNMSHGDHSGHSEVYRRIRVAAAEADQPVAILADLCGPKIRTGRFEAGSMDLVLGSNVTVTTRQVLGGSGVIPTSYPALADDVVAGNRILLDDGTLELCVASIEGTEISCIVVQGGRLSDRKGMNLPDVAVSAPSLTEKDRADAAFAVSLGVDLMALSFVRSAEDVRDLRRHLEGITANTGVETSAISIIAKIEKPEALEDIENIISVADGIMVARGDLGVELPPEVVPVAQDALVKKARAAGKPVIVATQMLDSMIRNARPTRAEVSDVSHAVMTGSDAVMLSGETAVGVHPELVVEMMDRIIRHTEGHLWELGAFGSLSGDSVLAGLNQTDGAVAVAAATLSRDLEARMIAVVSRTGTSARYIAAARPAAPIVVVTADPATARRINLIWGVVPILTDAERLTAPNSVASRLAQRLQLARPGEKILLVRGFHTDEKRDEPSITVLTI